MSGAFNLLVIMWVASGAYIALALYFGKVRPYWRSYERATEPRVFWLTIAMYAVVPLVLTAAVVLDLFPTA